jgi:hypothetical protein
MTTTAKTRTLRLTSRAKSPKRPAKKARVQPPAPAEIKETVHAAVEQIAAQVPTATVLDGGASMPAEQIGEPVNLAKGKAKTVAKQVTPEAKVDHSATLFALLDRPERVTPAELMSATGLSRHGVNLAVGQLLKAHGLKVITQKNPAIDPADRKNTAFLYGVEKA